jgi:hypothetical protein
MVDEKPDYRCLRACYFKPWDVGKFEARVYTHPVEITIVHYNPSLEPGSPEFWGMVLRAGWVHFQWESGSQFTKAYFNLLPAFPPFDVKIRL